MNPWGGLAALAIWVYGGAAVDWLRDRRRNRPGRRRPAIGRFCPIAGHQHETEADLQACIDDLWWRVRGSKR